MNAFENVLEDIYQAEQEVETLKQELSEQTKITDNDLQLNEIVQKIENEKYSRVSDKEKLSSTMDPSLETSGDVNTANTAQNSMQEIEDPQFDENGIIHGDFLEEGYSENAKEVENNEKDLDKINNNVHVVTYVSGRDKSKQFTSENETIGDYLEQTPNVDKTKMSVEISVNYEEDIAFFRSIKLNNIANSLEKLQNGEELLDSELGELPIRYTLKNEDGSTVMFKGKPVYGYMRSANYYNSNKKSKEAVMRLRKHALHNFKNGVNPTAPIIYSGKGTYASERRKDVDKNYSIEILGDVKLAIADTQGKLYEKRKGKDSKIARNKKGDAIVIEKNDPGFVFATTVAANGDIVPIRLNGRKVNDNEANVLYEALLDMAYNGFNFKNKLSERIVAMGYDGLTYEQLFRMMIYTGKDSMTNSKYPFYLNFEAASKGLFIANDFIPLMDFKAKEADIKNYLKSMWRTVRSDLTNQPMSEFNNKPFKWNGVEIDPESSYNDFISKGDDKIVSTNVIAYDKENAGERVTDKPGVVFLRPVLTIAPVGKWTGENPLSKSEMEAQAEQEASVKKEVRDRLEQQRKAKEAKEEVKLKKEEKQDKTEKSTKVDLSNLSGDSLIRAKLIEMMPSLKLSKEDQSFLKKHADNKYVQFFKMVKDIQENDFDNYFDNLEKTNFDAAEKEYVTDLLNSGFSQQELMQTVRFAEQLSEEDLLKEIDGYGETKPSQQKQEAQQKFQEYVDATGRQDIEGFKEFIENIPADAIGEVDGEPSMETKVDNNLEIKDQDNSFEITDDSEIIIEPGTELNLEPEITDDISNENSKNIEKNIEKGLSSKKTSETLTKKQKLEALRKKKEINEKQDEKTVSLQTNENVKSLKNDIIKNWNAIEEHLADMGVMNKKDLDKLKLAQLNEIVNKYCK